MSVVGISSVRLVVSLITAFHLIICRNVYSRSDVVILL